MSLDSIRFYLLVSGFGILGVLSRVVIVSLVAPRSPNFPTGTFIINLLGSFLIGFVAFSSFVKTNYSPEFHKALVVGLLGGFTTFSSFSLELFEFISAGRFVAAAAYGILSPTLGVFCAWLGAVVALKN